MTDTVQLVLKGSLLPGHSLEAAGNALAGLLKINEERAQAMLAGSETVIKQALPREQEARYLALFERIGVHAYTRQAAAIQPETAPASSASPAPSAYAPITAPGPLTVAAEAAPVETITCPSCGFVQPKRTLCRQCSADMPRVLAAQRQPEPARERVASDGTSPYRASQRTAEPEPDAVPAFLSLQFEGRLNRLRYMAYSALVYLPVALLVLLVAAVMGASGSGGLTILVAGIGGLACFCLSMRVMALRLHDFGLSGRWLWLFPASGLMLITGSPIAAMVLYAALSLGSLALCLIPGHAKANEYGTPNGANSGLVVAGAVAFALIGALALFSGGSEGLHGRHKAQQLKPVGQLSGGIMIEESDDPVEQEALVRKAVDKAAEEQGINLTPSDREETVQRYLQAMRGEAGN
ncbi:DUF805 domain-containing protein [Chitinimonas sp.]|uniref:DUF805 domain-containing protein n=1 Tax=Chitinimonas sp. TaxID=1934313 RepID=UPI002F94B4D6